MGYLGMVSMEQGRKAGMVVVAGIALGLFLIGLLALSGASFLWEVQGVYKTLKISGVFYMLYLAYDCWRQRTHFARDGNHRLFMRGFITNMLNPKALIFYVTVIPPIAGTNGGSYGRALFLLCVSVVIATISHTIVVYGSAEIKRLFKITARDLRVRLFFTLMLMGVAFWIGAR